MTERAILHCDINNFFASVALLEHPELKDKPIAVCGNPEKRHGIILAKNMIAKACDVRTGEAIWVAKQKCGDLVILPTEFKKYMHYSHMLFGIYTEYTSEVESFGMDECWLDVTGSLRLFGTPEEIAYRLKDDVKRRTGLTISVGVSFTKTFSKLGSDLKKPDAVSVISKENFKTVAWRLPVSEMLSVGRTAKKKLNERNVFTIGELANCKRAELVQLFGKFGDALYLAANGEDNDEVKCYIYKRVPESVGNGMTAAVDISNLEDARALVYSLSELIATRLREIHMLAMGVQVNFRDSILKTFSRQSKLLSPVNTAKQIADEAMKIIKNNYDFAKKQPLRTITVTAYYLSCENDDYQPALFKEDKREQQLEGKVDGLRQKYGYNILKRGINLNSKFECDAKEEDGGNVFGKENLPE